VGASPGMSRFAQSVPTVLFPLVSLDPLDEQDVDPALIFEDEVSREASDTKRACPHGAVGPLSHVRLTAPRRGLEHDSQFREWAETFGGQCRDLFPCRSARVDRVHDQLQVGFGGLHRFVLRRRLTREGLDGLANHPAVLVAIPRNPGTTSPVLDGVVHTGQVELLRGAVERLSEGPVERFPVLGVERVANHSRRRTRARQGRELGRRSIGHRPGHAVTITSESDVVPLRRSTSTRSVVSLGAIALVRRSPGCSITTVAERFDELHEALVVF